MKNNGLCIPLTAQYSTTTTHLSEVCDIFVYNGFRVNVFQIPSETLALKTLPKSNALRHISVM